MRPTCYRGISSDSLTFSPLELIDCLDQFARAKVLIIGDVMLDEYLTGDADRISPEAPVPVVRIKHEEHLVGGAGNVARNIIALGGHVVLVGARGEDAAGRALEAAFAKDAIPATLLTLSNRPTTIKTRVLARQQQVVRIDREADRAFSPDEYAQLIALAADALPDCEAVVLSDYGKGVIAAPFLQGLRNLLNKNGKDIPFLVDPKPQNFSLYHAVTLLTPNAKEVSESVAMPVMSPDDIIRAGQEIFRKLGCDNLVITLGSRGMAVFQAADEIIHIPTTARQVYDVTGAGDTVISVLALGAAAGLPLTPACLLANYAAGIVVAQVGAAVATQNQIAEAIATLPYPEITRWK